MNKTQRLRNLFDKLFRVKTAVILWIIHMVLYGICLYFCYVTYISILIDIFGGISWAVNIVAYISSAGAIIRTFINRDLVVKRKILAVVLIVAVYFVTTGILYLAFAGNFKAEIEAGDWSEWTTEEDLKKIEDPEWGEE